MEAVKEKTWTDLERKAYLVLITREMSTKGLASALGVSTMTAARAVAGLRKNGVKIVSVRDRDHWHYDVTNRKERARERLDRLRRLVESVSRKTKPSRLKPEDEAIYGED